MPVELNAQFHNVVVKDDLNVEGSISGGNTAYTPTLAGTVNSGGLPTLTSAQFHRIGSKVTVQVQIGAWTLTSLLIGVDTELTITVPAALPMRTTTIVTGHVAFSDGGIDTNTGYVLNAASTTLVTVRFTSGVAFGGNPDLGLVEFTYMLD